MSTSTIVQNAMSDNLAFSLMARLHVILRRQNGRVTDIEYMRVNPAYCRAILDLSMGLPHADLHEICLKLEDIYFGEDGLFVAPAPAGPLLARLSATQKLRPKVASLDDDSIMPVPMPLPDHNAMVDQTYIGRLR
ncbi:hypothetical protein ACO0LM_15425 [Undibacterium sp. Di26W]|uniref:hypothetical protein n=1 Tax=Undibacterium sp. Di26W TaxID=3413035 RepID=UPI003BEF7F0F